MPPHNPRSKVVAHYQVIPGLKRPGLTLACGCRVEEFNEHGIIVTYCPRHNSFVFSPRPGTNTDVFYLVTEDNQP